MPELDALLQPGLSPRGDVWVAEDDLPADEPWSDLASDNPIFAAISVADEDEEVRKSRPSIELLEREIDGGVVLDVACGYGRLAKYLLPQKVLDGYVGYDGSPVMLKEFRARYERTPAEQRTPLLLVHGRIDRLRLRDASVQVVLFSGVLLHNPKHVVRRALQEAHRVLAPGGKLIVVRDFPNARSLAALQGRIYLWALARRGRHDPNGPLRYFTEAEVRQMLSGFTSVRVDRIGFQLLPKTVLGLPPGLARLYRRFVVDPLHGLLERVLPASVRRRFYTDLSAVAVK